MLKRGACALRISVTAKGLCDRNRVRHDLLTQYVTTGFERQQHRSIVVPLQRRHGADIIIITAVELLLSIVDESDATAAHVRLFNCKAIERGTLRRVLAAGPRAS